MPSGGLRIGALVPNSDLAYHALSSSAIRCLSSAILAGASPQLRNMASTGGNLLQRTRCHYFYDTATPCNKREPGSGCSAIGGHNRMHAILGASDACIADSPVRHVRGAGGAGSQGPCAGASATAPLRSPTSIGLPATRRSATPTSQPDEIITAVELPARGFAATTRISRSVTGSPMRSRWYPSRSALELDGDTINEARLALGGVAHKPWRDTEAEAALRGQAAQPGTFAHAADIVLRDAGLRNTTRSRSTWRADPSCARFAGGAGTPQSQSNKKSREQTHGTLYRQRHFPRRRPCEGHRRRKIRRRVPCPDLVYGYVVSSTIAKGRILRIDTSAAARVMA